MGEALLFESIVVNGKARGEAADGPIDAPDTRNCIRPVMGSSFLVPKLMSIPPPAVRSHAETRA